jgi:hypothetical protein
MAYVYSHTRLDTGNVFYIGIGSDIFFKRANANKNRNKHWINIYNKCQIKIDILYSNITWKEACYIEQKLILELGRIDLNNGQLVNLTGGGEGKFGFVTPIYTKNKISNTKKGVVSKLKGVSRDWHPSPESIESRRSKLIGQKRTDETKLKMSLAKKGKVFSSNHKANLSKSRLNKFNYGNHPQARIVLNIESGIFYMCAKEAAIAYNINYGTLSRYLKGTRKNKTSLIYV